ncbi:Isochorismatase-like protein [Xylogone sp. PMI_703]|nr:Isochorismatase-like protein [Xylogone sp. PMI_703]
MSKTTSAGPVLLVVDIQQCLVEGDPSEGPRSTPNLEQNVTALLSNWRSRSWPVVHINHRSLDPADPLHDSHPESNAPHPCAAPIGDEKLLLKHGGSAFVDTELSSVLDALNQENAGGKRKLVIIGMDGAQCINSTTRHAADLGHDVVVVSDACSTYGIAHWKPGKAWSAEESHEIAMSMLEGYGKVTTANEVIQLLGFA